MTSATFGVQAAGFAGACKQWLLNVVQTVVQGFRSHSHLYAIAMLVYAIGIIECLWLGSRVNYNLVSIVSGSTFIFLALIIAGWLVATLISSLRRRDPRSPTLIMALKLREDILSPTRVSNTLHAFLINGIFFVGFIAVKKSIPTLYPFAWDQTFMQWDRALHFGALPHEWLAPLMSSPEALYAINAAYNLWFVLLLGCFFWFGFSRQDSLLRQRYILAYITTWALGTLLLGTIFASAGPCYYGFVVAGDNHYAGLLSSLQQAHTQYTIWAVPTQETLWLSHQRGYGDVEGISAMPSMHVGTSVLFMLLARATGQRWFIWFTTVFALTIFIGSIVLGWHYAIDGYAGAAIAIVCWWASGKYLKKFHVEGKAS
jgi:PAP2 superfamily